MKLLFDQNLSHRLVTRLEDIFGGSAHVRLLGMDRATDTVIWQYARDQGHAIVTQDSDFMERSKLFGCPPYVVWLRCGNVTPQKIEAILRSNASLINELGEGKGAAYLELF